MLKKDKKFIKCINISVFPIISIQWQKEEVWRIKTQCKNLYDLHATPWYEWVCYYALDIKRCNVSEGVFSPGVDPQQPSTIFADRVSHSHSTQKQARLAGEWNTGTQLLHFPRVRVSIVQHYAWFVFTWCWNQTQGLTSNVQMEPSPKHLLVLSFTFEFSRELKFIIFKVAKCKLGMVTYVYNPSTWKAKVENKEFKANLGYTVCSKSDWDKRELISKHLKVKTKINKTANPIDIHCIRNSTNHLWQWQQCLRILIINKLTVSSMALILFTQANFRYFEI